MTHTHSGGWSGAGLPPVVSGRRSIINKGLQTVFHWIAEPRVQRAAFFFVYLLHVVAGIAIVYGKPYEVKIEIGEILTIAWGTFLAFGGTVGAVAVLPGWNFVERIGILSVLVGVALTSIVIVAAPWADRGVQVTVWSLVTGWIVIFALRLYEIRFYIVAPRFPLQG